MPKSFNDLNLDGAADLPTPSTGTSTVRTVGRSAVTHATSGMDLWGTLQKATSPLTSEDEEARETLNTGVTGLMPGYVPDGVALGLQALQNAEDVTDAVWIGDPTLVGDDFPTPQDVLALLPFGYLSGAAGTGKTFLARQVIDALPAGQAVLAATTGIAAVNLGDATTINALLSYFDTASLMDNYARGFLGYRLRQLRKSGVRLIVLDEVSMMPADQLTILVQALDEIDRTREYDAGLEEVVETFDDDRRLKLLLVGDFAQLPPVKAEFAFESPEWTRFEAHTLKLSKVRRQGDTRFVEALLAIRQGHPELALELLEPRMVPQLDIQFDGTTIVAKNDAVDRINTMRHAKLMKPVCRWETTRSGEQQTDWTKQIPNAVEVKEGALVMILSNLPHPKIDADDILAGFQYVNGDLATVVGKVDAGIRVVLHRSGEEVTVIPNVKEWREPTGKRKPPYTVKGAITYMPLRLAYATTVHKSQGLTLDACQVSISDHFMGNPGSLYVALSRCRGLEGLRIVGNSRQLVARCGVDSKVRGYL